MWLRSLFFKTISDCAGLFKRWAAAGGVLSILLTVLYAVASRLEDLPDALLGLAVFFQDLPGILPDVSGEWMLEAAWFLVLPAFVAGFSVDLGSRLLSGPEQGGQIELLLAYPISRRRLLLEKYAVLLAGTAGITLLVWAFTGLGFLAAGGAFPGPATAAGLALLGLVFGSAAFALSGRTGSLPRARGIALALLALALGIELTGRFLPSALGFLMYLSPLADYAGSHLLDGSRPGLVLLLAGVAAVLVLLAVLGFDRREIS